MKQRKLAFSVSARDCEFKFTKGTGPGGQKRNKTSSACICYHKESGAMARSDLTRSAEKNKIDAFWKMTRTKEFNEWFIGKIAELDGLGKLGDFKVEVGSDIK